MRYEISADAACAPVEDGAVVLHMGTKRYFSLNETGAAIWRLLEDDVALGEIPARLGAIYQVEPANAEDALSRLLEELAAEDLLTLTADP